MHIPAQHIAQSVGLPTRTPPIFPSVCSTGYHIDVLYSLNSGVQNLYAKIVHGERGPGNKAIV